MQVTIDPDAGFCFGVERAIGIAEKELALKGSLICLGEIVHNSAEVERLQNAGLRIVTQEELPQLSGKRVLFRAHGEPPSTFAEAEESGLEVIDATCPIVLRLQQNINQLVMAEGESGIQVVIFGKKGHPEVRGLVGHSRHQAIVVNTGDDLSEIDFSKPVRLYSQTTMSADSYESIAAVIRKNMLAVKNTDLVVNKSYCRQVSGRTRSLREFAAEHDVIIFASDKKSSNGEFLYNISRSVNHQSYFVHDTSEILPEWFTSCRSVGVTGATSTPHWLMEEIASMIEELIDASK